MKVARAQKAVTSADLELAIRERYQPREWAVFAQVRNGTGYSRSVTRTADALALGLWPSRGMELHGFEIKTYRADWLREGEDPEKAEEIAAYCDRWWIVTVDDVVADGELPPTWGLLVLRDGALVAVREAEKRPDVKPLDRSLIAAILRSSAKAEDAAMAERVSAGVEREIEKERKSHKAEIEVWKREVDAARKAQSEAEDKVDALDVAGQRYRLESLLRTAQRIVADIGPLLTRPSPPGSAR